MFSHWTWTLLQRRSVDMSKNNKLQHFYYVEDMKIKYLIIITYYKSTDMSDTQWWLVTYLISVSCYKGTDMADTLLMINEK